MLSEFIVADIEILANLSSAICNFSQANIVTLSQITFEEFDVDKFTSWVNTVNPRFSQAFYSIFLTFRVFMQIGHNTKGEPLPEIKLSYWFLSSEVKVLQSNVLILSQQAKSS